MNFLKYYLFVVFLSIPLLSKASGGGAFGFNVALATPFLNQYGLNYVNTSKNFSAELVHSAISLTITDIVIGGQSDAIILRWHPFSGSFFLGAGFGQKTVYSEASQTIGGANIRTKFEIKSATLTPTLGWMWGIADGGFFGGFDVGYQTHLSPKSELTSNADDATKASAEYVALEDSANTQGEKLGKLALPVITLFRIGYLF